MTNDNQIISLQEPKKEKLSFKEQTEQVRQERIQKWLEQKATNPSDVSFESKKNGNIISIEPIIQNSIDETQKEKVFRSNVFAATGTVSKSYGSSLLTSMFSALSSHDKQDSLNAAYEALLAMKPQDEQEGMLCSRLIMLHDQYMHFMAKTVHPEQSSKGADDNINRATKLMRLYNETLETLNRHRRKGEQRVTVQHVNVNQGGQAIVTGEMNGGSGVNTKK